MHAGMQVRGVTGASTAAKEPASASLQEYCTKVLEFDVRYLLYVEEDKELYIAEYDGNITSISVENGNVVKRLARKCDCVWGLAAVRDELWAVCSDGDIIAYQRSTGKLLQKWQAHHGGAFCIASVGDRIVSGGADWVVRVWRGHQDMEKCYFGHTNAVRCLLVVDNTIWSGADDRSIRVWPLNSLENECLQELQGHTDSVLCMCKCDTVSPPAVWSSGADQTIRVWDSTYRCSHKLKAHKGWVTGLVVAGRTVWSCSADRTIVVWDTMELKVKRTLRDHSAYLRGITVVNYQIVSYAADRSIRFWHCTELYKGMIQKIQNEIAAMADQLLDKGKKEGELRTTLVDCYSTIETLEREVETRRQASKERDELKNTVAELTSRIADLEKDFSQAAQSQTEKDKMLETNFNNLVDLMNADAAMETCNKCLATVQKMDVDVKEEKAKLQKAEQKLEELFAKHAAQSTHLAHAERTLAEKEKEWQEKLRRKEEGFEKERSGWHRERGSLLNERDTQDSSALVDEYKLKEASDKYVELEAVVAALKQEIEAVKEENKNLNEKILAGEQNMKALRRRAKKDKDSSTKMEDYTKKVTELEQQLATLQKEKEDNLKNHATKIKELELQLSRAAQHEKSETPTPTPKGGKRTKVKDIEQQLAKAQQERDDGAKKIKELEQQLAKAQQDKESSEIAAKASLRKSHRLSLNGLRTDARDVGIQINIPAEEAAQDVMKLTEEVDNLSAEVKLQKEELEQTRHTNIELEKTVENLKQELSYKPPKPQAAIQALIDKTHRLEAQLNQAQKENQALLKYQREAQKQAELKEMIEGMITKVLDMETQLFDVKKERDELSEQLSQIKSSGVLEKDGDKRGVHNFQLLLNQTRAQNNILEAELKTTREKLKKEEEERQKSSTLSDQLQARVSGLEELLRKIGSSTPDRPATHSFF